MKTKGKLAAALCILSTLALFFVCGCSERAAPAAGPDSTGTPAPAEVSAPGHSSEPASEPSAEPSPEPAAGPTAEPLPESPPPTPDPEKLVRVLDYIPDIYVELRYAAENNFTGEAIYDFDEAYLRYGTVLKLAEAQKTLSQSGLCLKIWDAFRPVEAQFALWEICPDANYVADPNTGYSSHSRGDTVDVTLVRTDGTGIEMPTDFDDFSPLADRDYSDVSNSAAENARTLENAMTAAGFEAYYNEWWHFSDAADHSVYQGDLP